MPSAPLAADAGITPTTGDGGIIADTTATSHVGMPATANNAMETVTHTSALNSLDPIFYTHFIRFASVSWSSGHPEGHTLYALDIAPGNLWPNLAYVMKMYNTWAGGIELKIEVAGTGFNGGKLLFVRFPPNVNPEQYNLNAATVLNSVMMDVKAQGSAILQIPDYRNTMFHYNQKYTSDFGSLQNIAGNVRILVMLPLITSSTGTNFVNLQVSGRLLNDFVVGQMIPPILSDSTPTFDEGFGRLDLVPHFDPSVRFLTLTKMSVMPTVISTQFGIDDLAQFQADETTYLNIIRLPPGTNRVDSKATIGSTTYYDLEHNLYDIYAHRRKAIRNDNGISIGRDDDTFSLVDGFDFSGAHIEFFDNTANIANAGKLINTSLPEHMPFDYVASRYPDGPTITATQNESLIGFSHNSITGLNGYAMTTSYFVDYTLQGGLKSIDNNMTIVFQLIDRLTSEPLLFVRWWSDGYFTSHFRNVIQEVELHNVYLRFHSYLSVHSKLPDVQPTMAVSFRQHILFHRT